MNIALIASFLLTQGSAPQAPPIDSATKTQTIDALVKAMNDDYFFPDLAKKVEVTLKAKDYASVTTGPDFAKALTEDMKAICHDAHLRVRYSADSLPVRKDRDVPSPDEIKDEKQYERLVNGGFEKIERLPGNVGYIRFFQFFEPEAAAAPIRAAMDFVQNTDALIFDIRGNGGGDPETVRLICSYLFDAKPVHLNDIYFEKGKVKNEFWTLKSVPGKRYTGREIYVLTGPRTGSGAEEFAYDLQNLHRATIVGASTWGGANPGGVSRLNDHFAAFIPNGQAKNPYTKTNWEGAGVQPDIAVKPEDALTTAHRLAVQHLLDKATAPQDQERLKQVLGEIK
jgi:C-terminal processing protease CtpA/Prc